MGFSGKKAIICTGYYGTSTPNAGATIDILLLSTASDIFQFVEGYTKNSGISIGPIAFNFYEGLEKNGTKFSGFQISAGVSIAPIEVHNGTGYAEYVKVKEKENLRIVSSGFALDGLVKSVAGRGQNYYPTKCRNLLV